MKSKKTVLASKIAATLAAGTIIMTGSVFAAEPEFQLDQITVTATRTAQTVASTPGDVTVITAEQIEQKGAKNLADALEGETGVNIIKQGHQGNFSRVMINGSDSIVLLIDGKRLNIPQGVATGRGPVDFSNIIVSDNIEKIEVVRGGNSALYGSDAVGGVINIITKKGQGAPVTRFEVGRGSDASYKTVLSNQGSDGNMRWYITGLKEANDGYRANNRYEGDNFSLRLDKDLDANKDLSMTFEHSNNHVGLPGTDVFPSLIDFSETTRDNWGITYTNKSGEINRKLSYYGLSQDIEGIIYGAHRLHENLVNTVEYQQDGHIDKDNYLTWGGEWRKEEVNSTDEGNSTHNRNVQAFFVQNDYLFNTKTKLSTGLRYENNSQFGNELTPKVSVNYQHDVRTNYYASWGKVFKAPTFDDLYTFTPPGDGYGAMLGNPNLKPETGWTAEMGMKKQLDKDKELSMSVYKRDIQDAIGWEPVDQNNYFGDWSSYNIHNLVTTGANLSYKERLSNASTFEMGYSYTDARDEKDNQQTPNNLLHVGISVRDGKLTQRYAARYTDKFITEYGNKINSSLVWDANFGYALGAKQSVYLNIYNVFDKQYQDVLYYPAPGRSIFLGFKQTL